MLIINRITLLQSAKLSEIDVAEAGTRTRPLRCSAIRGLSSASCRSRNLDKSYPHVTRINCIHTGPK